MSRPSAHFSWGELGCRDGTPVPPELRDNARRLCEQLEVLRAHVGGKEIRIRSAYRTPSHNAKVGGKPKSRHLTAEAADIVIAGMTPKEVHASILGLIQAKAMHNGGLGLYPGFVHYDIGRPRRW